MRGEIAKVRLVHTPSSGMRPLGAGPESIVPAVVMDSGLALRAPRRDEKYLRALSSSGRVRVDQWLAPRLMRQAAELGADGDDQHDAAGIGEIFRMMAK